MNTKRQYRTYTKEFKEEAIGLITEQGYTVPQPADALGVSSNLLYTWEQKAEELETSTVSPDEKAELLVLRKEVKQLNERPRKTLKFKTPKEMMEKSVALTS